jgi:hypothetical protein
MLLNTATKVYGGNALASKIYLGDTQVWPAASGEWTPDNIAGLAIWLDAADYSTGPWTNKGTGPAPVVLGSPDPVQNPNVLNGLPVVRFTPSSGMRIQNGSGVDRDWTLVYIGRNVGPMMGRIVNAIYTPANLLVGYWTTFKDVMYDAGFTVPNQQKPVVHGEWNMYSGDGSGSISRLFSDGIHLGSVETAGGWQGTFSINGYSGSASDEMNDCEVAEVLLYNRKISDVERKQVEDYLHDKWFVPKWDPDTQAYLTATGLDVSFAPALDGLVTGLKTAGLWTKMLAIYPFIGGTEALHKWNLKDPRDLDEAYRLTFTGSTSSHSTNLGYRPNAQGMVGNGGYADSHIVPYGIFEQNSTSLAYYSLADVTPMSRCEMGCYNWNGPGSRFHIIARYTPTDFYYGMSEDGITGTPVPASTGLFVATRTGANYQAGYRNGILVGDSVTPSVTLPNVSVWVGGINVFVDRSDLPCGFASVGTGLSPQDNVDLNLIVTDYQVALGRRPAFTDLW